MTKDKVLVRLKKGVRGARVLQTEQGEVHFAPGARDHEAGAPASLEKGLAERLVRDGKDVFEFAGGA